ncbi:MAG TPA: hypothetical protein VLA75_11750 [Thermoanaerobaculia bacterium]|nr:hypothetical protein [Thermoanaerobaculia bacterium]
MRRRRRTLFDRSPPAPEAPEPAEGGGEPDSLPGRIAGALLGIFAGRIEGIFAAVVAGFGGAFLMLAWHLAPAQLLKARELARLTERAEAEVTAAWLVLEVEPSGGEGAESGERWVWRHRAGLRPCVATRWSAGEAWRDDVFCGAPRPFGDHLDAAELRELGPGVPFAWPRGGAEQAGAPLLDLRIAGPVRDRLARQAPDDFLLPDAIPELGPVRALGSELALLGHELDRPVDLLVAGWSRGDPAPIPLAYDPRGEAALPVATVERARRPPGWAGALLAGLPGLFFFQRGLRQLFGGAPPWAQWGAVAATLLLLPWWGERLPRAVGGFFPPAGEMLRELLGEALGPAGGVARFQPEAAPGTGAPALGWSLATTSYADTIGTLGTLPLARPEPPPDGPDAAFTALSTAVAEGARRLSEAEQGALFAALARDKAGGWHGAGVAFLDAAREAVLDPERPEAARREAARFLSVWVTRPAVEPGPPELGRAGRLAAWRRLAEVPDPAVRNLAASAVADFEGAATE